MERELVAWAETVGRCTDPQLMAELRLLVRADKRAVARMVVCLGEVDARGLYREHAHSSLFSYAVTELRMSEAEAYLRICAARVARRYPVVIELLAAGALHLSALKQLAPHLTEDNHVQLLERVRGKTKREVELLVSELAPSADVPGRMRKLPVPVAVITEPVRHEQGTLVEAKSSHVERALAHDMNAHEARSVGGPVEVDTLAVPRTPALVLSPSVGQACGGAPTLHTSAVQSVSTSTELPRQDLDSPRPLELAAPRSQRASCTPLRPGRYKLELTASQALHDKLEQLKQLLRHQVPDADLATIVERACDVLLAQTLKKRFAQLPSSRSSVNSRPGQQASCANGHAQVQSTPGGQSQPCESAQSTDPIPPTTALAESQSLGRAEPTDETVKDKPNSRYIPRAVIREVYARDAGQCSFVSSQGRRCTERGALELHHKFPYARGGCATADNLQLVCPAHNALFADRDFGADFMRAKRRGTGFTQ